MQRVVLLPVMPLTVALPAHLVLVTQPRVAVDTETLQRRGPLVQPPVWVRVLPVPTKPLLLPWLTVPAYMLVTPTPQPVLYEPVLEGRPVGFPRPPPMLKKQELSVVRWRPLRALNTGRLPAVLVMLVGVTRHKKFVDVLMLPTVLLALALLLQPLRPLLPQLGRRLHWPFPRFLLRLLPVLIPPLVWLVVAPRPRHLLRAHMQCWDG